MFRRVCLLLWIFNGGNNLARNTTYHIWHCRLLLQGRLACGMLWKNRTFRGVSQITVKSMINGVKSIRRALDSLQTSNWFYTKCLVTSSTIPTWGFWRYEFCNRTRGRHFKDISDTHHIFEIMLQPPLSLLTRRIPMTNCCIAALCHCLSLNETEPIHLLSFSI